MWVASHHLLQRVGAPARSATLLSLGGALLAHGALSRWLESRADSYALCMGRQYADGAVDYFSRHLELYRSHRSALLHRGGSLDRINAMFISESGDVNTDWLHPPLTQRLANAKHWQMQAPSSCS